MRPDIRQFGALTAEDFVRRPVWVGVHTVDYDEPWYDDEDIDEESFRPHDGPLPVSPDDCMYLVGAQAVLADGSTMPAFLTPASRKDDLGTLQPHLFAQGRTWSVWGGLVGTPSGAQFHMAVNRSLEQVFPMHVVAGEGLASGVSTAVVRGWSGGGVLAAKRPGLLRRLFGGG